MQQSRDDAKRNQGSRAIRLVRLAALLAVLAVPAAAGDALAAEPGTRDVMFVGNNWDGTADIIDANTFERLARINTIPDKDERMQEIQTNPAKLAFFLAIRQGIGEGNDQFTDDMFSSHDGRFVYVSRPSFADVVGIELATGKIVWRFPMEGYRADHMAISPDGTKLLVSDSTANKVHQIDTATGKKSGEFASGDSPHENNYSRDGSLVFHASIGRVYTPTDQPTLLRDTTKGDRWFQVVDGNTLQILKRWDMGEKLAEAGYPDMESAVRPMAIAPDERYVYFQVSFFHGFVEFDLQQERVLRVANLPVSEGAQNTPREQYVLDSAHHGLAMNDEGTKLCAAGTMSDYAAIVSRETFAYKIFEVGPKPYWSTNGPEGTRCWVSVSGEDKVVVLDYASERQVASVPVGDHPQRVRAGVVRTAHLSSLPLAPGVRDTRRPALQVRGMRRGCRSSDFRLRVSVNDQSSLRSVEVRLNGRRLRRTRSSDFAIRVPARRLRTGTHRIAVIATDSAGNRSRRTLRFSRCASTAVMPRFVG